MNKVIFLGTIHSSHLRSKEFSLSALKNMIETISPNSILTEITPKSYTIIEQQLKTNKPINEERVNLFPEYTKVILPLSKTQGFKIYPCSAWTQEMSDFREKKLEELSRDPKRRKEWIEYVEASQLSNELIQDENRGYDPAFIHSQKFDDLQEIALRVYDKNFNDDLGLGGWTNINKAHYTLISDALDDIKNEKILISFGAGHKGWMLRELRKRKDIELINLIDAL